MAKTTRRNPGTPKATRSERVVAMLAKVDALIATSDECSAEAFDGADLLQAIEEDLGVRLPADARTILASRRLVLGELEVFSPAAMGTFAHDLRRRCGLPKNLVPFIEFEGVDCYLISCRLRANPKAAARGAIYRLSGVDHGYDDPSQVPERVAPGLLEFLASKLDELAAPASGMDPQDLERIFGPGFLKEGTLFGDDEKLGDDGAVAIANAPELAAVTALYLAGNRFTAKGLGALLAAKHGGAVEELRVFENKIRGREIAANVRTMKLASLRDLTLDENPLGDDGPAALAKRGVFAQLTSLSMIECAITGDGLARMFAAGELPSLTRFALDRNPLGAAGAAAFATAQLPALKNLGLTKCKIGDDGLRELVRAPALRGIRHLSLMDNDLTDASVDLLVDSGWKVMELYVRGNALTTAGQAKLKAWRPACVKL